MPFPPLPPVSDCPGPSTAPRPDVARSRARSPRHGEVAIDVAVSHAQFPLRRHPHLLVDHRRAGSASVADSRGADAERLTGSGGRLHFGMVAGIKSERWPASNRNRWLDCVGIRNAPPSRLSLAAHNPALVQLRQRSPNVRQERRRDIWRSGGAPTIQRDPFH